MGGARFTFLLDARRALLVAPEYLGERALRRCRGLAMADDCDQALLGVRTFFLRARGSYVEAD